MTKHYGTWALGLIVLAAMTLGGCNSELKKERDALYTQSLQLQDELTSAQGALSASEMERNKLLGQVGDLEQQLADAQKPVAPAPTPQPGGGTASNFGGPGVSVAETAAKITVRVASDIIFDSGKATLKATAKRTLANIAAILNQQYPGNIVRVEGHTDSDPIRKTKHLWRNNYHLSEARATAVRDYLLSKGVSRNRLMIVGHGPDKPMGTNKTKAGKAQNRRVEIIVVK